MKALFNAFRELGHHGLRWRRPSGTGAMPVRLPVGAVDVELLLTALRALGHQVRSQGARGTTLVAADAVPRLVESLRAALADREGTVKKLKELERRPHDSAPSSPWAVADALGGGARAAGALAGAVAAACCVGPLLRRAEAAARDGVGLVLVSARR